jgi:cyclic pyranopterin monophosphate synthase
MSGDDLSHLDSAGRARMVDISGKPETERWAVARAKVLLSPETLRKARTGDLKKGDLRAVAELAGVMAAKRTPDLIPLCHPIPLTQVQVEVAFDEGLPGVVVTSTVRTTGRTGVEMEAMTAVTVAALAVYDMVKGIDRRACITDVRLLEKHGGRSGDLVLES